jgi:tRNA pseudouridine55 synthase
MHVMTLNGIINMNKPPGMTSRDAVNRVERLCRPAKAGHAGTLDPLATGVLVICVGQATRLNEYVQRMRKQYRATFLLGRWSESDDTEREVSEVANVRQPTRREIDGILPRFVGSISQRPPVHSAIKVHGQRAYKLARQGVAVELRPRIIEIHSLRVCHYEYPTLEIDVECGSGTYVRALGRDLAAELGTTAVMSALVRTAIGRFRIEEAVAYQELNDETLGRHLQPPLTAVAGLANVMLTDSQLHELRHGRPISNSTGDVDIPPTPVSAEWVAIAPTGELAAILREKRPGQLWPHRNFMAGEPLARG